MTTFNLFDQAEDSGLAYVDQLLETVRLQQSYPACHVCHVCQHHRFIKSITLVIFIMPSRYPGPVEQQRLEPSALCAVQTRVD